MSGGRAEDLAAGDRVGEREADAELEAGEQRRVEILVIGMIIRIILMIVDAGKQRRVEILVIRMIIRTRVRMIPRNDVTIRS